MQENNKMIIRGKLLTNPQFSHELYGEKFYEAEVSILRESNTEDKLIITISERLIKDFDFGKGFVLNAKAQLRSYNKNINGKSKLILTVFITEILDEDKEKDINDVQLTGYICKQPIYRKTPLGREIADVLIAVNRNYHKSDYIPCIVWGRNAKFVSDLKIGDMVTVNGRFQSREYKKTVNDTVNILTAYELSVNKITVHSDDELDLSIDTSICLDEYLD